MTPPRAQLLLQYKREGNLSTGALLRVVEGEATKPEYLEEFETEAFKVMLTHLARAIAKYPELPVFLLRLDRPGLLPYALDGGTHALFRTDPCAAIKSLTYAPMPPPAPLSVKPILRAGYDTLAEAFGEDVFFQLQKGAVQCPGCAQWTVAKLAGGAATIACRKDCPPHVMATPLPMRAHGKWLSARVTDLLLLPLERFFLPCAWNEAMWITRQALTEKYNDYKAEKEDACLRLRNDKA